MFKSFFDLEATDKNPNTAEVLTGYFETWHGKELVDTLYVECRPDLWIPASEEIHGISQERAMNFPPKKEGMRKIFSYLKKYPDTLVCHANYLVFGTRGYFDWQLLRGYCYSINQQEWFYKTFYNYKVESTHTIAKEKLPELGSYDLKTLANYYGLELNHHEAKSDTEVCRQLYFLLTEAKMSLFDFMEKKDE